MAALHTWSWVFLTLYVGGMMAFGLLGRRRVKSADDFATARQSYGPLVLGIALASTTASGATFLGLPGLAYRFGFSPLWIGFIYSVSIYGSMFLCQRLIARSGNLFGNRSIPEYLGDRFQSDTLRIIAALTQTTAGTSRASVRHPASLTRHVDNGWTATIRCTTGLEIDSDETLLFTLSHLHSQSPCNRARSRLVG